MPARRAAFSRFVAPAVALVLAVAGLVVAPAPAAAGPAQPSVSPTTIDFESVGVGTSSAAEPVTLFNESGDTALHVTGGGLTGTDASQFTIEPAIGSKTIAASESALLTLVRYAPTTTGVHHATLSITTDMGNVTVALAGTGVVAAIEVTPRDLQPFGEILVGTTSDPQSLTISNSGGTGLNLIGVSLAGANPTAFGLVSPPTPGVIDPLAEVSFEVVCTPQSAGALLGEVVIESDDPGTPVLRVPLSCTGTVAGVTTSVVSLDFGNVRVNATETLTVTVNNTGAAFTLDGPTILPGTVDVFSLVSPTMPVGVASGNSITLTFSYSPVNESQAEAVAVMTLDYGASVTKALQIPLRGRGVQPHGAVSATAVDFGDQRVGTQGQRTVVVSNTGGTTLTISELTGIELPFSLLSPPLLPVRLVPNGEVTFTVAFTPTDTGDATGALAIVTDDPSNTTLDVDLSGTGIAPNLLVTPTQLEFASQRRTTESSPQTITLVNTGSDDLTVTAITLAGTGADAFSVTGASLPATLVNGAELDLEVRFAPAAAGDYAASVTITSDDLEEPAQEVTLTGTGLAPQLLVTPGEDYAFPDILVGKSSLAATFTVTNADQTPLPLDQVRFQSATDDFVLDPGDVSGTLGVGASVSFAVTFTPTTSGTRQATLELLLADDETPALTVVVHGVGADSPTGGGCRAAGRAAGGPGLGALFALVAVVVARRRGRGRRS